MEIREIGPGPDEDLARALLRVQRAAYAVEAALLADDRIPPLRETLAELRAEPLCWLGAYDEVGAAADRLVGAVAWTQDATTVDVDRLVVDPAAHRRGIGRALVEAVLARAGGRRVLVATGRANLPARALYEGFGFTAVGDAEPVPGLWITRYELPDGSAAATRSA